MERTSIRGRVLKPVIMIWVAVLAAACQATDEGELRSATAVDAQSNPLAGITEFQIGDRIRTTGSFGSSLREYADNHTWITLTSGGDERFVYDGNGNFIIQTIDGKLVKKDRPHSGWLPEDGTWTVGYSWSHAFKRYNTKEPNGYARRRNCKIRDVAGEVAHIRCANRRLDRQRPAIEHFSVHIPTRWVLAYRSREFRLHWNVAGFSRAGS